jgi:hypothetical protein
MPQKPGRSFGEMGQGKNQSSFWGKKSKFHSKKTLVVIIGTNVGVVSPWVIIFNPNDI